ncbi:MAG: hypothetical protein K6G19_08885, partial [Lachnospiraceae bacterium]|nr:hypothetical protein [Lachnospiraceae bacterium]
EFGEQAAKDTLKDVNEGRVSAGLIEKYIFRKETKNEYSKRLKREMQELIKEDMKRKKKR